MSNGNNGGFKAPQRDMTIFDDAKFKLTAPNRDGKKATLGWSVHNGNPRITVWTNVESDRDKGSIQAAMDHLSSGMLFGLIRDAIAFVPTEDKKEYRETMENKNVRWVNKKPDGSVTVSKTVVGKNAEGVIYIAVVSDKHEKLKFEFLPGEWHFLIHADGSPWNKAELSMMFATSYVNNVEHFCRHIAITTYVHPPKKDFNGGGGNNGGSNNNNGNRGGNNGGGSGYGGNVADEDDIPF